jgi:hypothetical protein
MSSIAVKWNQTFEGFWWLANFLREEEIPEKMRLEITEDLTRQYDKYRGEGGKHFGPLFQAKTQETRSGTGVLGTITMQQPISLEQIGQVGLNLSDGVEHIDILPF